MNSAHKISQEEEVIKEKKRRVREEEQEARDYYGIVNYWCIQMDQPRGLLGVLVKGSVYGIITAGWVTLANAAVEHYKVRSSGKLIAMDNSRRPPSSVG